MNGFKAYNPRQLDICLKMLYADGIDFTVKVAETSKGKIVYNICIVVSEDVMEKLQERYRIMIS